ncbi:DUF6088 family protein [Lonepinella sp. BR2930]|uniref:DUF6088 family protein n=1 Tax=Lonepinella sp. BR2930 TaxID=3434554 RepID=UPI003F6E013A
MLSTTQHIREKIGKTELGILFLSKDFLEFGERSVVDKALSRMVKNNEINRAARGIFFRPKMNRFVGNVPIDIESVLNLISQQNGETLQIHGAEAARRLKLSTQMPMQTIFYTNVATRNIIIGNQRVKLLHTSNQRRLQHAGTQVGLVISALWYLGKEGVTPNMIKLIQSYLSEDEYIMLKNANLASWIHKAISSSELLV